MDKIRGFREGILTLPNGVKVPVSIDYYNMSSDIAPEMQVSVILGARGKIMLEDFARREQARHSRPFILPDIKSTIKKVIFNDPATIVIWNDNTKTVVKCQPGDTYSKELGLAMCISKKYLGNKGNFNEEFKKWILEDESDISINPEAFSNVGEALRKGLYNLGKSLTETYKDKEY